MKAESRGYSSDGLKAPTLETPYPNFAKSAQYANRKLHYI